LSLTDTSGGSSGLALQCFHSDLLIKTFALATDGIRPGCGKLCWLLGWHYQRGSIRRWQFCAHIDLLVFSLDTVTFIFGGSANPF
jgi:hypothetical protein